LTINGYNTSLDVF